jgi:hypothetical protein
MVFNERKRVNETKAAAAAQKIHHTVMQKDYGARSKEFYEVNVKKFAKRYKFEISEETDKRIRELLKEYNVGSPNEFETRKAIWQELNLILIAADPTMTKAEKKMFNEDLIYAKTGEDIKKADERWLRWYLEKFGSVHISKSIEGSEYFAFFAEKLENDDQKYISKHWYWTYMFHMINETARINLEAGEMARGARG